MDRSFDLGWYWIYQFFFEYFSSALTFGSRRLFLGLFLHCEARRLCFFNSTLDWDRLAFVDLRLLSWFIYRDFSFRFYHVDRFCQYLEYLIVIALFYLVWFCILFFLNFLDLTLCLGKQFSAIILLKNLSGSQILLIIFHFYYMSFQRLKVQLSIYLFLKDIS